MLVQVCTPLFNVHADTKKLLALDSVNFNYFAKLVGTVYCKRSLIKSNFTEKDAMLR